MQDIKDCCCTLKDNNLKPQECLFLDDLKVIHLDNEEYYDYLERLDYLMWRDKCNRTSIIGFHYLERTKNISLEEVIEQTRKNVYDIFDI